MLASYIFHRLFLIYLLLFYICRSGTRDMIICFLVVQGTFLFQLCKFVLRIDLMLNYALLWYTIRTMAWTKHDKEFKD